MKLTRPIIFFDLETTGLNPIKDHIVQIGAIKLNPDGTREEKNVLINPQVPIPKETSDIHGITDDMVKDKPTFKQLSKAMLKWFSGCDISGYNTDRFDIPFLCESFLRHGLTWDLSSVNLVDVLKVERMVNAHKLEATYQRYFGKPMEGNAHDALDDTRATLEVFLKQCEVHELSDIPKIDNELQGDKKRVDLAGYIVKSNDIEVWNFGKHTGKDVRENPNYCDWFLRGDFPTQSKDCLNKILRGF